MKKILAVFICIMAAMPLFANYQNKKNKEEIVLKTRKDSISYSYGILVYSMFNREEGGCPQYIKDMDTDMWIKAYEDYHNENVETLIDPEEAMHLLMEMEDRELQRLGAEEEARERAQNELDLAEAEAFFAELAKKEGVVSTITGMQYEIIKKGDGTEKPDDISTVVFKYKLELPDGTVLAESDEEREVIYYLEEGLEKGISLMSCGDIYKFYFPYYLISSYSYPGVVRKYVPRIFTVELIDFD